MQKERFVLWGSVRVTAVLEKFQCLADRGASTCKECYNPAWTCPRGVSVAWGMDPPSLLDSIPDRIFDLAHFTLWASNIYVQSKSIQMSGFGVHYLDICLTSIPPNFVNSPFSSSSRCNCLGSASKSSKSLKPRLEQHVNYFWNTFQEIQSHGYLWPIIFLQKQVDGNLDLQRQN